MGEMPKEQPLPWMRGKEQDKHLLDAAVAEAKEAWAQASLETVQEKLKVLKTASRERWRKIRRWKAEYWHEVGARATDAARKGDQGELFRLLTELKVRRGGNERSRQMEL